MAKSDKSKNKSKMKAKSKTKGKLLSKVKGKLQAKAKLKPAVKATKAKAKAKPQVRVTKPKATKAKPMTVNQIANKLVTYCRQGKFDQCYKELYSPKITSEEPVGGNRRFVKGFKGIQQKGKEWNSMIVKMHNFSVGNPIVAGDHFSCTMSTDATYKGGVRRKLNEICVYKVENAKIVSEQFFY